MRLIDADAVVAMTATCPKEMDIDSFIEGMGVVLDRVYDAPTVDAVQVVRCKDCRHAIFSHTVAERSADGSQKRRFLCDKTMLPQQYNDDYWYCADGERKYDE